MTATLLFERAGPLTTIQDGGRDGMLVHGVSASGPMDRGAWHRAGLRAGSPDGCAVELTRAVLEAKLTAGRLHISWDGGAFEVRINGTPMAWPGAAELTKGDRLEVRPGPRGNYGYLCFGAEAQLPKTLGSVATSTRAGIGGIEGRILRSGDIMTFKASGRPLVEPSDAREDGGPLRFIWGLHSERFASAVREHFVTARFRVSASMDRMGVQLVDDENVFAGQSILSLVSDPVLQGDIQILGNGTPIVLMRDHQPTGGYPRIGTIISADLDRFAQLRPGAELTFAPVSVAHAHALLRSCQ